MKWLVTGGAGYIGSHVVQTLLHEGEEVIAFDSLLSGKAERLLDSCEIVVGDIRDEELVTQTIEKNRIEGIINLAALKSVEESRSKPQEYHDINHIAMGRILDIAIKFGVGIFIQSSTAAVYGDSLDGYVDEEVAAKPISPYGATKLAAENALNKAISGGKILGCSLRYFNVLGSQSAVLKDASTANIVPMVLSAISKNQSPKIFGDDYLTPDGTCIRDYVHVEDIANAHVLAATNLKVKQTSVAINIGTGSGYSVREIISEILIQMGSSLQPVVTNRRQGDPAILVAKVDLAIKELGFKAQKTLEEMITSSI